MPINHFPPNLPETIWWTQVTQPQPIMEPAPNTPSPKHKPILPPHHHPLLPLNFYHSQHSNPMLPTRHATPFSFNLNQDTEDDEDEEGEEATAEEDEEEVIIGAERQPMFEKPLTPSDVGKLNRLVIPKQHAEKYFPLGGDSGEKGLLLSFEDECGKCWRFRYSYWNSSQSYVLTKGWSRFVKEKRLDAGDIVLFQRDRSDADRFFIGWRRRAAVPEQDSAAAAAAAPPVAPHTNTSNTSVGWTRVFYSAHPYPSHPHAPPLPYQTDCLHAGSNIGKNQTPAVGNSKRLRLFGVNLECQMDESEPSTPDGSSLSSQGPTHHQFYPQSYSINAYNHMRDKRFAKENPSRMVMGGGAEM